MTRPVAFAVTSLALLAGGVLAGAAPGGATDGPTTSTLRPLDGPGVVPMPHVAPLRPGPVPIPLVEPRGRPVPMPRVDPGGSAGHLLPEQLDRLR